MELHSGIYHFHVNIEKLLVPFFFLFINHGREVLAFIDVQQWGHDSNFTINILLRTLRRMDHIPDVLCLQMDNCWRENKNQFVIIFLAVLVKHKVFKKVLL